MRNADTVLGIIQDRGLEQESLESHVIRKAVMRGSEEGRWKSTHPGNSLAAYPTSRWDLREAGGEIPPAYSPTRLAEDRNAQKLLPMLPD
jgi:hypothetical protein